MKHFRQNRYLKYSFKNKENTSDRYLTISLILTGIIIIITGYYAYQTYELTKLTSKQFLLSSEPNIELSPWWSNKLDSTSLKFKFKLLNQSEVDLINIKISSKYYTHLIDDNLTEAMLLNGIISFHPDTIIQLLLGNDSTDVELNYRRSGLLGDRNNASFFFGEPPNVKSFSAKEITKFYNSTYAKIQIDYQRKIDGKSFKKEFYYLIALANDKEAMLIRNSLEDILDLNRQTARMIELTKSLNK